MNSNISKCLWTACLAVLAVCLGISTAYAANPNLGTGMVTAVTPVGSACVHQVLNDNGVEQWDVEAGGTYVVTLSNVTECTGESIQVIVKSSNTGNQTFTASAVPNVDFQYTFTITMPANACQTYPILYCTVNGSPNSGYFARRSDGVDFQSHLRAATFGSGCSNPTPIDDCGGTQDLGCLTACKYYDFNANGVQDPGELPLSGWPMTIDNGSSTVTGSTTANGCVTFSNIMTGAYDVTEGTPIQNNWVHSTAVTVSVNVAAGTPCASADFGNYCTKPSGGLTLGFWSNKNGNKILTGNTAGTGTTLLAGVVNLLNSCSLRNADGTVHTFTNSYSAFRTWLLGATATNMAYMLSAQLAAMELNVNFGIPPVDGTSFDLCSGMTVNGLMAAACSQLGAHGNTTAANDPTNRAIQEGFKNCLDALNNGGPVIPATPCQYSFPQ